MQFALASVVLFWPALWDGKVSAFRDGFHFYFPQAVWLDQAAQRGEYFPQWQSDEALGVSVPGETTSALYYPPRIVGLALGWKFIGLQVAQRMALFVVAHLFLAAGGIVYACSRWGLRREASWLAGAAFAFSCPVFYQHHNLVFLCSAAWLGFAFAEVGCWLRCETEIKRKPRLTVLATALAMMVLAGDPHTAVNVVIVSVFLRVAMTVASRKFDVGRARAFVGSMGWLSGAVGLAVLLSAVQSVPSLLWSAQSHRWLGADSLKEQVVAPEDSVPSDLLTMLAEPATPAAHAIYEFSLSPWHLLTAVWPTIGGDFAGGNSRTFAFIPAEGRMWVPSLFFGVVSLWLVIRRKSVAESGEHRWWVLGAVFALLAAMGNYTLGWALREMLESSGAIQLAARFPADHVSGVYGWFADLLPGYSVFRYPAKWTVIAMACLVLAVAVRFDGLVEADLLGSVRGQRFVMVACGVACGVALLLTVVIGLQSGLGKAVWQLPEARLRDAWLGSPDMNAMWQQLLMAFAVPCVVLLLLVGVRRRAADVHQRLPRVRLPVHAFLAWITLLETLVVASTWVSFVAVDSTNSAGPWTAEVVWADAREADIEGDGWLDANGEDVRVQMADYQRQFALGKLALLSQQRNLAASLSIEPERLKRLRSGLSRMDTMAAEQPRLDELLGWLGVEQRLVRERSETGAASFRWQRVAGVKPLCEFTTADLSEPEMGTVSWQWLRSGRLEVVVDSPVSGKLLVRQFNDGGWVVRGTVADIEVKRDVSGLFIEVPIASQKSKLLIERERWPVGLGVAISFVGVLSVLVVHAGTALCLFGPTGSAWRRR